MKEKIKYVCIRPNAENLSNVCGPPTIDTDPLEIRYRKKDDCIFASLKRRDITKIRTPILTKAVRPRPFDYIPFGTKKVPSNIIDTIISFTKESIPPYIDFIIDHKYHNRFRWNPGGTKLFYFKNGQVLISRHIMNNNTKWNSNIPFALLKDRLRIFMINSPHRDIYISFQLHNCDFARSYGIYRLSDILTIDTYKKNIFVHEHTGSCVCTFNMSD